MSKIIALFNNKGGVSKTTTTFHLGWKLAEKGYRTLIVDTDPQCNLTGLCLNTDKDNKLENFYKNNENNIKDLLSPVFNGSLNRLEVKDCYAFANNKNLFLLPGHIDFSEYDATYNIAENLVGSIALLKNVPGAFRELLKITAEKYSFDYILVDMSPNISATNANILMESDFFILPCAPDYFCYMAIESLTKVFPKWDKAYCKMKEHEVFKQADYKMHAGKPRFIGTIQQRYRPRNGSPSKAFSEWINDINRIVSNKLVPVLRKCNMIVSDDPCGADGTYNLANIADFNSLIAQSQANNTPVFLLTQEQVQKSGSVWNNMEKSIQEFNQTFDCLADRVVKATK